MFIVSVNICSLILSLRKDVPLEIADEDMAPANAPNIPLAILLSNIMLIFSLPILFGLNFFMVCSEAF